jgi:hypothetical protein
MANGDIVLAPSTLPPELRSVVQSNMPAEHKTTQIRAWYDKVMAKAKPAMAPVETVAQEGASLIVGDLVGAATGAVLGFIESQYGSLDFGKRKDIPADAAVAGLGAVAALLMAGHPSGAAAVGRYVSVASTAIYSQRKSKEHFDAAKGGASVHGESGEESPLLRYAKEL